MLSELPNRCNTSLLRRFVTIRYEIGANSQNDAVTGVFNIFPLKVVGLD